MAANGLALLIVAAALMIAAFGGPDPAGMPSDELLALLAYAAVVLTLTGWAVERARPRWGAALGALVMWAIFVASTTAVYVRRDAVIRQTLTLADEIGLTPPAATVISPGEVAVTRRYDGSFILPGAIDGHPVRFVFDTGASTVVLTHETAQALGLHPGRLDYRVPVSTANGRTMAAPVTLDGVTVGSIGFRRVFALVAAPGLLHENLLGQTFLERLTSYEVRGKRLLLRAEKS